MRIQIYIGNTLYAERDWETIPRLGEQIELCGKLSGVYEINFIRWEGDENPAVIIGVESK